MRALLNFIKYNNGFPFLMAALFLGASVTFAATQNNKSSETTLQGTAIAQTAPSVIDTSVLLKTNLDQYDIALKITAVRQDAESYFVSYSYRTLAVMETAWQTVPRMGMLTVNKKVLGSRDLGWYVAEQLSQVVNQQMAYLKEAQGTEKNKTRVKTVAVKGYDGLTGSALDAKDKSLSRYATVSPTSPPREPSANQGSQVEPSTPNQSVLTKKEIEAIIVKAVADFLAVDTSLPNISEKNSSDLPQADILPADSPISEDPVQDVKSSR
jgi:hypothetical protein